MNNIDIQAGHTTDGKHYNGYDVLINGDHHEHVATHGEAIASARAAAGDAPRYDVRIRDFTTMGEGRTASGVPFAIIPRKPQA